MPPAIIEKISKFGKSYQELTLDTVRKFFVKEKGVRKPIDKKSNYVKRCVGLPGDSLEIINGFVHTNGKRNQLPDRAKVQYTFSAYNAKGVSARQLASLGYRDFFRKYRINSMLISSYVFKEVALLKASILN